MITINEIGGIHNMTKKLFFYVSMIAIFMLAACGKQNVENVQTGDESAIDKLSIYTTVYPLQYFTERIGGEHVDVQSIYPPGADEHTFDPTQKDMIALADSDVFFYIGLPFMEVPGGEDQNVVPT